jgi:predicted ATPase
MFIVEDLHWIDPTTLEFLNLLVKEIHTAPILTLFTCRSEFSSPWTDDSNVTRVDIRRLPNDEATELTCQVAHGKTLPAEVMAEVVSKTDGVALFVEELTKMLLESVSPTSARR